MPAAQWALRGNGVLEARNEARHRGPIASCLHQASTCFDWALLCSLERTRTVSLADDGGGAPAWMLESSAFALDALTSMVAEMSWANVFLVIKNGAINWWATLQNVLM